MGLVGRLRLDSHGLKVGWVPSLQNPKGSIPKSMGRCFFPIMFVDPEFFVWSIFKEGFPYNHHHLGEVNYIWIL